MGGYTGWVKVRWTTPTHYNEVIAKATDATPALYASTVYLNELKGHDGSPIPVGTQIQFGVNVALGKDTAWSDPVIYDPNGPWLGYKTKGTIFKSPALNIVKIGTKKEVMDALGVAPGPPLPQ